MRLITIQQAADELGISVVSLHGTNGNQYQDFRHKTENSRVIMFDIDGYLELQNKKESLTEKAKLFVEYLFHIEGMSYVEMAKIANLKNHQQISTCIFGFKYARKFVRAFSIHRPFHIMRFDQYYNWQPHAPIKVKVFR